MPNGTSNIIGIANQFLQAGQRERLAREEQEFQFGLSQWADQAARMRDESQRQFNLYKEQFDKLREQEAKINEQLSTYKILADDADVSATPGYMKLLENMASKTYRERQNLTERRASLEESMKTIRDWQGRITKKQDIISRVNAGATSPLVGDIVSNMFERGGYQSIHNFMLDAEEQKDLRERFKGATEDEYGEAARRMRQIADDPYQWAGFIKSAQKQALGLIPSVTKLESAKTQRFVASQRTKQARIKATSEAASMDNVKARALINFQNWYLAGKPASHDPKGRFYVPSPEELNFLFGTESPKPIDMLDFANKLEAATEDDYGRIKKRYITEDNEPTEEYKHILDTASELRDIAAMHQQNLIESGGVTTAQGVEEKFMYGEDMFNLLSYGGIKYGNYERPDTETLRKYFNTGKQETKKKANTGAATPEIQAYKDRVKARKEASANESIKERIEREQEEKQTKGNNIDTRTMTRQEIIDLGRKKRK